MDAVGLPPGFREARGPVSRIVFDGELEADLEALGWLAAAGLRVPAAPGSETPSGRGATLRCTLPRSRLVVLVRPVLHGGLLGGVLGGALRTPERAFSELRATAALRAAGAPVPRPVLAAARRAGVVWHAWVATAFEPDAPDVASWLAARPSEERVLAAARACARAVRRFHDAGGSHADLHVKNLLLRETPAGCEAVVVDLDGARVGAPPDPARRMRELARLYRSGLKRGLAERIGLAGHRAFLQAYVDGDVGLGAALARHWPRERRRVALHALGYEGRDQEP